LATQAFTKVDFDLGNLISQIGQGTIGLPEIQRPFVWKPVKVRDLFDSMYRGYPVGYLLFWANPTDASSRTIGTDGKQMPARVLVVDGQQRLTSLYAVMRAKPVLNANYVEKRIHISFNPMKERFDVLSAAIKKDPEWVQDISEVWAPDPGLHAYVGQFVERLRASREVTDDEQRVIGESLQRLHNIIFFPFTALQLSADLEEERVAEVFVRINSEGVSLKQADFILTLMSVFWEKGRRQLEDFAREAKKPGDGASPFNWFIDPKPDQLLRVGVALAFRRARLSTVYSILRGKDLKTHEVSSDRRDEQFEALQDAQNAVLDLTNWHEYFKSVQAAGYRSKRMVMSDTNLMYTYALYLVGREDFGLSHQELRPVIARWFFMSSLTARYTGSSETQMEADLARIGRATNGEEFLAELDRMASTQLTGDFFAIQLPNELDRSGTRNPGLFAYDAALCVLGARVLFSQLTVSELLDPSIRANKSSVERHHLFPKAYLKTIGFTKASETNQIANYALVEWSNNISIGGRPPSEYAPPLFSNMDAEARTQSAFWNALPPNWELMEYKPFLGARRRIIADVIRAGWEALGADVEEPEDGTIKSVRTEADVSGHWTAEEIIARHESDRVEFKSSARWHYHKSAVDKAIEEEIVKTVAAFMNADGGTLLIGVDDDGSVLGLDRDLSSVQGKDLDGFDLWLHRKLADAVGKAAVGHLLTVEFVDVDEMTICRVDVAASPQPVWANTSEAQGVMFVRLGASSQRFSAAEAVEYVKQHWDGGPHKSVAVPQPELPQEDGREGDATAEPNAATPEHDVAAESQRVENSDSSDDTDLEQQFHQAMVDVYLNAKSEAGYNASRFIQMVSEHGGLETARILIHSQEASDGFRALWEAKRLDLSVEALVLDPVWEDLFTADECEISRSRLSLYDYEPE